MWLTALQMDPELTLGLTLQAVQTALLNPEEGGFSLVVQQVM